MPAFVPGCGDDGAAGPVTPVATLDELMDPLTCAGCHAEHYQEWSGSMHAYAADDPLFLAMNARGQRETDGDLGDFCVRCHAPMAVELGLTTDGLNLGTLDQKYKGVTCYFCHSVVEVAGSHNNPLVLADDGVMRGGIQDPVDNGFHASSFSTLHDRNDVAASGLCGSCHDIVTPAGVHMERTYDEWLHSLYSNDVDGQRQTCGGCHMRGRDGVAVPGDDSLPERRLHAHLFPGVDLALTEFPERDAQRAAVERELSSVVLAEVCVSASAGNTSIFVTLENLTAGHAFPSGAAADRRVWVELRAWALGEEVLSLGVRDDDEPLTSVDEALLWRLGDRLLDDDGAEVHMFWDSRSYESELLPAPTAVLPTEPGWIDTHRTRVFPVTGATVDRITMRVLVRPVGLDVYDDLIASGDLDPSYRALQPTFELTASSLEWTPDLGGCVP